MYSCTYLHCVVLFGLGVRAGGLEVEVCHQLPGGGRPAVAPVGPAVVVVDDREAGVVRAAREPGPIGLALAVDKLCKNILPFIKPSKNLA